ncbi:MAG: WXG100 family type VII secretion target [Jatrophihabitans sp.]
MSGYAVESGELFAAQAMIAGAAGEARSELMRLRAAAQDLFGHGWRGQAATAFTQGWREWAEGAQMLLSALDEMGRALGITAADYEQNECTVESDFHRIAS